MRGHTWDAAIEKCRNLLDNMDALETIQKTNFNPTTSIHEFFFSKVTE